MSVKNDKKKENPETRKLDIRGKLCPMTFIYTKLALEEMNSGEILEILVDYPPAVENIPYSCKRQDLAELFDIKEIDSDKKFWQLILRKL
ncbi:MAG: sulfurtransferase TusA family protein [Promethearchaeota archaeon]